MFFERTKLDGALLISPDRNEDERGHFARVFCQKEFANSGLDFSCVQTSISYNHKRHTLRGMHFQKAPHEEAKLVRCTRGAIYDVIVDLRTDSVTYKQWFAAELSEKNQKSIYIPRGFAHGFETLEDETEVFYMIDQEYVPESSAGFRYDDQSVKIEWPIAPLVISERDLNFPPL